LQFVVSIYETRLKNIFTLLVELLERQSKKGYVMYLNLLVFLMAILFVTPAVTGQVTYGASTPASSVVTPPVVDPLSDRIPIGSERTVRKWIVSTNGAPSKAFTLSFFVLKVDGTWAEPDLQCRVDGFSSYEEYASNMTEGAIILQNRSDVRTLYTTGDIWLNTHVFYTKEAQSSGLWLQYNLGPLEGITSNLVYEALMSDIPALQEQVFFPVKGLTNIIVEVSKDEGYSWSLVQARAAKASWPPAPPADEPSRPGMAVFSHWYSTGEWRTRITLETLLERKTYTQFGESLRPPRVEVTSNRIALNLSAGADLQVEFSPDLKNWTPFVAIPWNATTNFMSFEHPFNAKQGFFRAGVQ